MRFITHREDLYDVTDYSWISIRFQSPVLRFYPQMALVVDTTEVRYKLMWGSTCLNEAFEAIVLGSALQSRDNACVSAVETSCVA
jgi:hypothetical protein